MKPLFLLLTGSAAFAQQAGSGVNFYSVENEIRLGNRLAAEMQHNTNAHPDERLEAVGGKIAATSGVSYQFRFYAYDSVEKQMEATALPGGPVFVAQNLITADEPLTAAMLAHAMLVLRHYTRLATRADLMRIGAASAGQVNPAATIPMGNLADSQVSELQADERAVTLLRSAGYDPHALIE